MKRGVLAGNFDVMHPGYIKMFKECKTKCGHLTVLLHTDPTIERPEKLKPILSVEERKEMLLELRSVDEVKTYTLEAELYDLLKEGDYSIRFLGSDYVGKTFTGDNLNSSIYYISRDHGWSTTKFKNEIAATL
jgi:glycerol-3-phosphate cytidylyltransferase